MFASKYPNYRKRKYFLNATHLKSLWGDNAPTLAYFFPLHLARFYSFIYSVIYSLIPSFVDYIPFSKY